FPYTTLFRSYSLMPMYALTVLLTWAVLVPGKLREGKWRGLGMWTMMLVGAGIGVAAFWLDGWSFPTLVTNGSVAPPANEAYLAGTVRADPGVMDHLIGYIVLFAAALGMMSWHDHTKPP